jgi:hypothetical protein
MANEPADTQVVDERDLDGIAMDKRPTRRTHELSKTHVKLDMDLEDANAVAEFLEAVAKCIRDKKHITLIID